MKQVKVTENKVICENKDSIFAYFGWPTVKRLPDGVLMMACSGFRLSHIDPFGKVVACYSFNNGKSWTRPCVLLDTPLDDRDGGIAVFGNGRVMVTTFNNRVEFQREWINKHCIPNNIDTVKLREAYLDRMNVKDVEDKYLGSLYMISDDGGYTFSEFKKVKVSAPHGPCALPSGGLIYLGIDVINGDKTLYCAKLNENDDFEIISSIECPEGKSWEEPYAYAIDDNHIIAHIREENSFSLFQTETYDGGKIWSEPVQINEYGAPSYIMKHSSGVLVATYSYRKDKRGQRAIFSKDNGKTWSDEYTVIISEGSYDLGYPTSVELENGEIMTVYYQEVFDTGICNIKACKWTLPEEFLK